MLKFNTSPEQDTDRIHFALTSNLCRCVSFPDVRAHVPMVYTLVQVCPLISACLCVFLMSVHVSAFLCPTECVCLCVCAHVSVHLCAPPLGLNKPLCDKCGSLPRGTGSTAELASTNVLVSDWNKMPSRAGHSTPTHNVQIKPCNCLTELHHSFLKIVKCQSR